MRNNIKHTLIIAIVAAIVIAFSGCDNFTDEDEPQTIITINGLDDYNGKFATGGIASASSSNKKNRDQAIGWTETISNGSITWGMINSNMKAVGVTGQGMIVLIIHSNASDINSASSVEIQKYTGPKTITPGVNPPFSYATDFIYDIE